MNKMEENGRTKFLKIYANIPEDLRKDIICVVEDKTYNWNTSYIEIKDDTLLGKKILKVLEVLGILWTKK